MQTLINKNILIISPEAWGTSFLSKHYYARELSLSNRVWFLNPPHAKRTSSWHPFNGSKQLTVISDNHIRGLKHLPGWLQKKFILQQIRKLEQDAGCTFDVVWNFDNSRYFHLDCFKNATTIHHVVDDHMNYNFEAATKSARICFGVTKEITENLLKWNVNSHCIGHGFSPFEPTEIKLQKTNGRTSIAYVGNLMLKAFDAQLMLQLSVMLPETDFFLIGSYTLGNLNATLDPLRTNEIERLASRPNIHLLGEKTPEDAFTLASQADVQLVLYFNSSEVMTNSSKLPFYLNNGNVIVGNYFTSYEGSPLLRMCKSREEFAALLQDTIFNLRSWNNDDKRKERQSHALQHTYHEVIRQIDQLIISTAS